MVSHPTFLPASGDSVVGLSSDAFHVLNKLGGFERLVGHDSGTFKYFMKIVPTEYRFLNGAACSPFSHLL